VKLGFSRPLNPPRVYFVSQGITLQPTLRHVPSVLQDKSRALARQLVIPVLLVNLLTKTRATLVDPVLQGL
jgi:hypothetical protein